ncbi:hypothetical protein J4Q44_G00233220 [Coregonus suidteri]|uniref:Uncharacterized protein n=1 Tax=Coregonus suidteri TaxID=861788 RepID=A0AAN8QYI9_9TELE
MAPTGYVSGYRGNADEAAAPHSPDLSAQTDALHGRSELDTVGALHGATLADTDAVRLVHFGPMVKLASMQKWPNPQPSWQDTHPHDNWDSLGSLMDYRSRETGLYTKLFSKQLSTRFILTELELGRELGPMAFTH